MPTPNADRLRFATYRRESDGVFDDAYDGAASAGSAVADVETRVRSSLALGVTTATKRRAE